MSPKLYKEEGDVVSETARASWLIPGVGRFLVSCDCPAGRKKTTKWGVKPVGKRASQADADRLRRHLGQRYGIPATGLRSAPPSASRKAHATLIRAVQLEARYNGAKARVLTRAPWIEPFGEWANPVPGHKY